MDAGTVQRIDIEERLRSAYLSYAMSVITARALPDVRDGLKPVQRRILYAMLDMGLRHNQPTRKSARIVGEVLGKYHPHGDSAVYEAMVRMAQDFSMRYVLVEGQGNFGSVDGDSPAAVRYTEARLSRLGEEMLADLDKDTVELVDNFDGTLQEPAVLPARLPNLLVNGVGGIAVGMATNIPPHNLGEICDAIVYLIDRYSRIEDVTLDELMTCVRGPDFPTGGTILGLEGIRQAYATGHGRITMRAQAHMEELSGGRSAIIVSELPFQVNKATLVERIAALVRDGKIDGIADLRDETDRTGMRIVIELKRGAEATPILAALLKATQMQTSFNVNMLALVDGEPRTLSLKRALTHYIDHRVIMVERAARHDLQKALARAHVLEGLLMALDHLDEVIDTIRRSRTAETALHNLMSRFSFSEIQAQAVLDTQLRRLAAMERRKLEEEYAEVQARIANLRALLASRERMLGVVRDDALALKAAYGDARRTRIIEAEASEQVGATDLVPDEEALVIVAGNGRVRRYSGHLYRDRADELVAILVAAGEGALALYRANTRDVALFVTDRGWAVTLPMHQLPDGAMQPQGQPLDVLARLPDGQRLVAALPVSANGQGHLFLATRQGRVKRITLAEAAAISRDGATVMGVGGDDAVVGAVASSGGAEMVLVSADGRVIRFTEDEVRAQGLSATGMKGIALKDNDRLVSLALVDEGELVLVTEKGFAKRTPLASYPPQGRGGQGISGVDPTKAPLTGAVAAAAIARAGDRLLLTTSSGAVTSRLLTDVPALERTTWGRIVTRTRSGALVPLTEGESVVGLAIALAANVAAAAPTRTTAGSHAGNEPDSEKAPPERTRPARTRRPTPVSHESSGTEPQRARAEGPLAGKGKATQGAALSTRQAKSASLAAGSPHEGAPEAAARQRRRRAKPKDVAPPPPQADAASATPAIVPPITPPARRPRKRGVNGVTQDTLFRDATPDAPPTCPPSVEPAPAEAPASRRAAVRRPPQRTPKG